MKNFIKNNLKEKLKLINIIIFNIVLLCLLISLLELYCAYKNYIVTKNIILSSNIEKYSFIYHIKSCYSTKEFYSYDEFREPSGLEYLNTKPSILLLGCSYTYGTNLDFDKTFSSQLSKYTKRSVFNLGLPGGSPREILFMLRDNDFINKKIGKNIVFDYVIYTYIPDHKYRLYSNLRTLVPRFMKTENKKLVYKKFPIFLEKSFLFKRLTNFIFLQIIEYPAEIFFSYYNKNAFNDLKNYIQEINEEIIKKFSSSHAYRSPQYIVLVYCEDKNDRWQELQDKNINIIKVSDLIGKYINENEEYLSEDNDHPNEKAWKIIIPPLAKKLGM